MKTSKKHILVPFDFSTCAIHAGRIAFYWAHVMQCEIVFLNACARVEAKNHFSQSEKAKALFDKAIEEGELPPVVFSFQLQCGIPEDEIKHYAAKRHPYLIIMGTRNKTQKQDDLIGSVTAEVLEEIKVPLLAVPEDSTLKPLDQIQSIAVATSLGKNERVDFDEMARILPNYQGIGYLVHIIEHSDKAMEKEAKMNVLHAKLQTKYPAIQIIPKVLVSAQSTARELNQFVELENVDLLVVRKANRKWFLSRLLFPSVAQNLVFHAQTPLLVV